MSQLLYLNQYFTTTLNVGGGIDDSQTTGIIVSDVSGVDTTKPGIALINYANPLVTSTCEWVEYTSINGSKELVGVTRGAEGFSAKTHSNGVSVAFPLSESHINRLADALSIGGVATNGVTTTLDEDNMVSNSATALATQQSIKAYVDASASTPWTAYTAVTPTSGTLDDPSFPIVFAGVDLSTTLYPGMRVKITQSTVKYFIITKVAFSTDTTVTLYGGTDYDLVDTGTTAISAFSYSTHKAPPGFPLDPNKWSVELTDTSERAQGSPTNGTWYNPGSLSLVIPIGVWDLKASIPGACQKNGTDAPFVTTLSTANNSESDTDMSAVSSTLGATASDYRLYSTAFRQKYLAITAKETRYVNIKTLTTGVSSLFLPNNLAKLLVRATSAYL